MQKILAVILTMAVMLGTMGSFSFSVAAAAAMPQATGTEEMNVWLIAGQSNAMGMGTVANYPSDEAYADYKTLFTNGSENVWYYGNNDTAFKACGFMGKQMVGAELGIVSSFSGTDTKNAVIKVAWGNTSLYNNTTSAQSKEYGTWTPPSYIEKHNISTDGNKVGVLYQTFMDKVDSGLAMIEEKGYKPVIKGIWFMQGEAETFSEAPSAAYAELLETLISDMRNDLTGISGANLSELPFVYGRILRNPGNDPETNLPYMNTTPYVPAVQAAQDSVAAKGLTNVVMVDTTTDLTDPVTGEAKTPVQQDGWHYDALTQQAIGEKFVSTVSEMSAEDDGTIAGEGTDASPFIIDSADKFVQVFGNGSTADLTKTYLLTGFGRTALQLPSTYRSSTSVSFKGKLIGGNLVNGEIIPVKQKINLDITFAAADKNGQYTGGIFNIIDGGKVSNLALYGKITAPSINWNVYVGALAGNTTGAAAVVENVDNYADITGTSNYGYGGISGKMSSNTAKNVNNYGNITATGANNRAVYIGGITGEAYKAVITDSKNYGSISGNVNVGGIAGYASTNPTIARCANFGDVSSSRTDTTDTFVGGIAGLTNGVVVTECYNMGNVSTQKYAGGILGTVASAKTASVLNCHNSGIISGTAGSGLVIGNTAGTFTVSGFYDIANPDVASVSGVTGGTVTAADAFGYGNTESVTENDVTKTSLENIITLTTTNDTFKNTDVWATDEDYEYPNLVNNKYVAEKGDSNQAGSGTDEDPFIIDTAEKFVKFFANGSDADLTATYLVTGFDETAMELPSTYRSSTTASFKGKLIGGNLVNGEIVPVKQKINLDITFTTADKNGQYTGGLFHIIDGGKVSNLAIYGKITAPSINWNVYVGALAGNITGAAAVVENVDNYADITGTSNYGYGGISGKMVSNTATNVNNYGNITATGANNRAVYIGGITGEAYNKPIITNSNNYGNISGNVNVGGIAGYASTNPTIARCANFGDVSSSRTDTTDTFVGGIAGLTNGVAVTECYNMGNISTQKYAGGILGTVASAKTATVSNCHNSGIISGTAGSGLVIGNAAGTLNVSGFYDIANPGVSSVAGAVSGTVTAADAYGYGAEEKVTENDVTKTSYSAIAALTETNEAFKNAEIWKKSGEYLFPNLTEKLHNEPFAGVGTAEVPYKVFCVEELKNIEKHPSASYIQMADINGMDAILCREAAFTGSYDGNGYTIDIAIDDSENDKYPKYVGLFAESSGEISNLTITGTLNAGYVDWQGGAGAFVGQGKGAEGGISNCNNYATVTSTGHQTAGIIGRTADKFKIYKCFNYGDVNGAVKAAGIVGLLQSGVSLYYSGNYGNVTGGEAAGLTTWSYTYAQTYHCFNVGTITSNDASGKATGLIGNISNGNTVTNIKNCYNAGTLVGNTTYGICWSDANKTQDYNIINCYNAVGADFPIAGGSAVPVVTNSYYLADESDEAENALTLTELKDASATLDSAAWSVKGDYQYPQLTQNALDEDYDAIDFALVTVSGSPENSEYTVRVCDGGKFYVQKGSEIAFAVVPGADFYQIDIKKNGEAAVSGIIEKGTVSVMIDGDSEIEISESAITPEIPEELAAGTAVIGSEDGKPAVINGAIYGKYVIIASKAPEVPGLKLKEFGVYAGKVSEGLKAEGNKIPAEAGKITADGSFGILIFTNGDIEGSIINAGGFTVPYAIYENINGETVEVYGNTSEI